MTEDSDEETLCDIYVFEAQSNKLIVTMLVFGFSKITHASLTGVSKDIITFLMNTSSHMEKEVNASIQPIPAVSRGEVILTKAFKAQLRKLSSVRADLIEMLSKITDISLEEFTNEATMEDLGIDSPMVTEMLNEILKAFGINIDMITFLFFANIRAVTAYLDETSGNSKTTDIAAGIQIVLPTTASTAPKTAPQKLDFSPIRSSIPAAHEVFEQIQYNYERIAIETKAANF